MAKTVAGNAKELRELTAKVESLEKALQDLQKVVENNKNNVNHEVTLIRSQLQLRPSFGPS